MSKVFLLSPPAVSNFFTRNARWDGLNVTGTQWYPIYLAYATGLLEKNGHECKLIDAVASQMSLAEVLRKAKNFSPDISVFYVTSKDIDDIIKIAEMFKERIGCYNVFVGPWISVIDHKYLLNSKGVDALALQEFDYTLLDIANNRRSSKIKGLIWKQGNKVITNLSRGNVTSEQLNEFPFVTDVYRRHLNIYDYKVAPQIYPFIDLFTGRGCCWGKCSWCLWPQTINQKSPYRVRKIENVIDELNFIKTKIPHVKEVYFQDDTMPEWRGNEIAKGIIEEGLDITWSCYSRANVSLKSLKLWHKTGCRTVHIGYESGVDKILNDMHKGITAKQAEKFTKDAHDAGLQIHGDFIFGSSRFETNKTIRHTIDWAKKLNIESYQFTAPVLYPKIELYEKLKKEGFLNDNGDVNFPWLSNEQLVDWTRVATKECYLRWGYIKRIFPLLINPSEFKRFLMFGSRVFQFVFMKKDVEK